VLERAGLVARPLRLDPLELGNARRRRRLGEPAWPGVVSGLSARARDELTAEAARLDVRKPD
jgi:hypothetical protein